MSEQYCNAHDVFFKTVSCPRCSGKTDRILAILEERDALAAKLANAEATIDALRLKKTSIKVLLNDVSQERATALAKLADAARTLNAIRLPDFVIKDDSVWAYKIFGERRQWAVDCLKRIEAKE